MCTVFQILIVKGGAPTLVGEIWRIRNDRYSYIIIKSTLNVSFVLSRHFADFSLNLETAFFVQNTVTRDT